jgi:hypothetical protein
MYWQLTRSCLSETSTIHSKANGLTIGTATSGLILCLFIGSLMTKRLSWCGLARTANLVFS